MPELVRNKGEDLEAGKELSQNEKGRKDHRLLVLWTQALQSDSTRESKESSGRSGSVCSDTPKSLYPQCDPGAGYKTQRNHTKRTQK